MERGACLGGRFVLTEEVARGGMGRIFRASDQSEGGEIAIKTVHGPLGADEEQRFVREAALLARLRHPGIVRYIAQGSEGPGRPWLAMEWLEGEDLMVHLARLRAREGRREVLVSTDRKGRESVGEATRVEVPGELVEGPPASVRAREVSTAGRLTVGEVLVLLRRVASALAALHAERVVHRDIKPANLFLVGGSIEQIKVLDLGTARATSAHSHVTHSGTMVGTPLYMAPEQVRADQELTTAVDVWALGCIAYECLVGAPPFEAPHTLALFAQILIEEPVALSEARPEVPAALAHLIGRMLEKDPARRLAGGAEVLTALLEMSEAGPLPAPLGPTIGAAERRVSCVLIGRSDDPLAGVSGTVRASLGRLGVRVESVAKEAVLATVLGALGPGDQAARMARASLSLRQAQPSLRLALATGLAEAARRGETGELTARATRLLEAAGEGEIWVDATTSGLLEGRFELARGAEASRLLGLREAERPRTLLGQPTRTVGRRRELVLLQATWDDCLAEPRSRAVLVTAGPGVGKSRLRSEFVRGLEARGEPFSWLLAQGDSVSAGSPFALLAPALRRSAGVVDEEPLAERRARLLDWVARGLPGEPSERVAAFLGEMIGTPLDEEQVRDEVRGALRAARRDPMLMSEQITSAFVAWLRAETARAPTLLVVEDLHWGDRPSIRLMDEALRTLSDRPLMVVALARPEVHEVFPAWLREHGPDEIRLELLTRKASVELAREVLGAQVSDERLDEIAERAGGNALYLEELIRAVAEDDARQLPETVIGMVQARLDSLGPDARRIMRAASVFGEVFHERGVESLVGAVRSAFGVREWLDDLTHRELLTALRDAPGQATRGRAFRFRHALVRDGAYALFTASDARLAHRLAGEWLEQHGEQDALVLAGHAERGGEPARAAGFWRRAAEQALEGNDLPGVVAAGERAEACGATGSELGAVRALMATAAYWQSRYREAADWGREAQARLPAGGMTWFSAAGSALVSLARLGEFDDFDRLFTDVRSVPASPGAVDAQLIALCRGAFQLVFKGRFDDADATIAQISAVVAASTDLDALTLAQAYHLRGVRSAMVGDVGNFLLNLETAVASFERAGDVRNVSLERTTVGWCYAELGQPDEAVAIVRASLAYCLQLRSPQAITYARANLGHALACTSDRRAEARTVLAEAIAETRAVANRRLEGWSHGYLAAALAADGEHAAAEAEAALAVELLANAPGLLAWALALQARARLALDRVDDALPLARQAMEILARLGGLLQGESLPPLVLAEALARSGDLVGARAAAEDALARLRRRAERLPRDDWRATFLARTDSQQTLALPR